MAKRKEERKKGSLLEYLGVEAEEKSKPPSGDIADAVYNYISSKGVVAKEDLFEWGKSRGYTTADIMRSIDALVKAGKIRRRLDEEGKLVYSAS